MQMNAHQSQDGHWTFRLGPIERWIAIGVASLLTVLLVALAKDVNAKLEKYGDALQALSTQQSVTNIQLTALTAQLADVPGLTRQMVETKVRLDDNTRRLNEHDGQIHELQQLRKLR